MENCCYVQFRVIINGEQFGIVHVVHVLQVANWWMMTMYIRWITYGSTQNIDLVWCYNLQWLHKYIILAASKHWLTFLAQDCKTASLVTGCQIQSWFPKDVIPSDFTILFRLHQNIGWHFWFEISKQQGHLWWLDAKFKVAYSAN